jgi:predicted NUDIX family NTP pyrophosphohydrolase
MTTKNWKRNNRRTLPLPRELKGNSRGKSLLSSTPRSAASAGILMYRRAGSKLEILLVHPGGPYWRRKDHGSWSIPKGEMDADEDAGVAALREFMEETGVALVGPLGPLEPLGEIRQRGGKRVVAFAVEGDLDIHAIKSNTFEIEWPPNSGKMQGFPEIDRAEWFDLPAAHAKILESQRPLLDRLAEHLGQRGMRPL